jgi:GTP cyclohydrolase I
VYALLKRPDERWVTMTAYDDPMFVEDVIREITAKLKRDRRVAWFRAHVESVESIHNHNAFATLEWKRKSSAHSRNARTAETIALAEVEACTEQLARSR